MNKIAFIGAGSMAEAIIQGLIDGGMYLPEQIIVTNRSNIERLTYLKEEYGVNISANKQQVVQEASIVMLAMKPKDVCEGIESVREYIGDQLVISVLAGISIQTIQEIFGSNIPIIRSMPNTSASIRMSATAIAASDRVTMEQIKITKHLFETIGLVTVVEEDQLDAVTALSGSGPAYIYYMVESLQDSAEKLGLEREVANNLILQTLAGAAEMLMQTNKPAALLRQEVTSPGGTTEAGIKTLQSYHFSEAVIHCVKQAAVRSCELKEMFRDQAMKEKSRR
ncbi:pyrroline-5-carboxylate reductase [Metabacillus arenae]|uniref:Pyrroline-5-carboxylate reductase n=1 Tax=Metabacillus arenae TaxID=2771434 RepID=A0A926NCQ7_9BACI|nr:pyrroline-5-carboxylate reductase [Metabacillus arenae]MBD1378745.1 pyrroline-5-carboxylate reductase [Metabacillus arenae]